LGEQMHQVTEIKRHQKGKKTREKLPGRTWYTDFRMEFAQKQRPISGHCDEEYEPSC